MGVDTIAALIFGCLFDKVGITVLVVSAFLSSLFASFVFLGGIYSVLLGIGPLGIGMGAQESVMRAAIA